MLNKVAGLFWSAVTLVIALFAFDLVLGTTLATTLWEGCWSAVWSAWNNPTNIVALLTAGFVLALLAGYDTLRNSARGALTSVADAVVKAASSVADSVKPKADA